jgi:hypothetical protein
MRPNGCASVANSRRDWVTLGRGFAIPGLNVLWSAHAKHVFSIVSRHRSKRGRSSDVSRRSLLAVACLIWVPFRADLRFYAGGPSRFQIFYLKGAAATEVHRAACSPQGTRGIHRLHSGSPAFRRPSINSFEFDCPPRAIHVVIVKSGSTSSTRAAASRASASRPRWAKAEVRQR